MTSPIKPHPDSASTESKSVVGWRVVIFIVHWTIRGFIGLLVLVLAAWGVLAIYYSNLPALWIRTVIASMFAVGTILLFVRLKGLRRPLVAFLLLWSSVAIWWMLIPARNDRDWIPEMAVTPTAEILGDIVKVRNIRNYRYRSTSDFDIRYEDRTYDLSELESLDLIISYWGSDAIAHTFLSFGFAGGEQLAVSIESRREKTENYHPLPGLFKQYELIYVIGDERDVIGVRARHRGEQVYLYPSTLNRTQVRKLFLNMLETANSLNETPAFYRTLGRNCTTAMVRHFNAVFDHPVPLHRYLLMNGYSDQMAYERGRIDSDLPFDEMKKRHFISEIVKSIPDESPEFSRLLRRELPLSD